MNSTIHRPSARSIVAAFATVLLGAACGGVPGGVDHSLASDLRAADAQRTVHGSRVLHFVDGNGHVTDVPDPIAPFDVAAEVRNLETGQLELIPALADGNQFTIPGVPPGPYELVFQAPGAPGVTHDVTDERLLSFDQFILGRSNVATPSSGTALQVEIDGLEAWDPAADDLQLTAPGAGLGFGSVLSVGLSPQTGDTSFVATVDYAAFTGANGGGGLIDTGQGDRVFLTQLTGATAPSGVAQFNRVTRAAQVPTLVMQDAASTSLSSVLAEVPQTSRLDLTVHRGEFDALRAEVGAGAQIAFSFTGVDALPAGFGAGVIGGTPDVITALVLPGTTDVSLGATYGNPFPGEWPLFGFLATVYRVSIPVPTDGGTLTFTQSANLFFQEALPDFEAHGGRPLIGPVHNPIIEGRPMLAGASGVGTTPRVSWEDPLVGTPTSFSVRLMELTVSGGRVSSRLVATLLTHRQLARIPPGLMVPGGRYVIVVTANLTGPFDPEEAPLRTGYPVAVAPAVSGLITP